MAQEEEAFLFPSSKKQKLDLDGGEEESKSKKEEEIDGCKVGLEEGEEEYISEPEDEETLQYYYSKFELIDLSSSSPIPIPVDLQELEQDKDVYLPYFGTFVLECFGRNTLILYDNPPRAYRHQEGECIRERDRDVAAFALEWYLQHCQKDTKLELVYVDKITCQWIPNAFYYVTFRVRDVVTNEEITMQAQVFEFDRRTKRNWLLGMLRDATNDRVLAVPHLITGPLEEEDFVFAGIPPEILEVIVTRK